MNGTGELDAHARAGVLLAVAVAVVLAHAVELLVVPAASGPAGRALLAATAVPWLAAAAWAALGLARGGGVGPGPATVLLCGGAVGVAVDGSLSATPGQDVFCAVGLTGIALALGAIGSPRGTLLASPVVLGGQVVLLLTTQGTTVTGWFVSVSTTAVTGGVLVVVGWVQRQRRSALAELAASALVDPLTGLLNRRGMAEAFARVRSGVRGSERVALIALDLDHFKAVNDTFGHDEGDRVLVAASDVLRDGARPGDLLVRLGGEEFAWIGSWEDAATATAAAERLRRAVTTTAAPGGPRVTVSAGVAFSTDLTHTSSAAEALSRLLVRADTALYRAKNDGRDRVVSADDPPAAQAPGSRRDSSSHDGAPRPQRREGGSTTGVQDAGGVGQRA